MRKVRLTDGTEYPVDRCGANDGTLFIRVTGDYNLLDLVIEFGVPEKTERIEHIIDGTEMDHVFFDGSTDLVAAQGMNDGIMMTLKKGVM